MKVKVYKHKKDTIDSWTIYFPYSKKFFQEEHKRNGGYIKGTMLFCSPTSNGKGMNRCIWEDMDPELGYRFELLGKRVHDADIPEPLQKFISIAEPIWNECMAKNTEAAWNKWMAV